MKVDLMIPTGGDGIYTNVIADVHVTAISLNYYDDGKEFDDKPHGELIAEFDNWDIAKSDLIYTDETWMKNFKEAVRNLGGNPRFGYSENGMQDDSYVSMDCGHEFLASELGKTLIQEYKVFESKLC